MAATASSPSSIGIIDTKETVNALQSEIQDLRSSLSESVDKNEMLVEEVKQLREELEFHVGAGTDEPLLGRLQDSQRSVRKLVAENQRLVETIELLRHHNLVLGDDVDAFLRLCHAIREEVEAFWFDDLKYGTLLSAISECNGFANCIQLLLNESSNPTEGLFAGLEMVYEDDDEEEKRVRLQEVIQELRAQLEEVMIRAAIAEAERDLYRAQVEEDLLAAGESPLTASSVFLSPLPPPGSGLLPLLSPYVEDVDGELLLSAGTEDAIDGTFLDDLQSEKESASDEYYGLPSFTTGEL
ncbi:hypothetical protein FRC02_003388 [Tulasnella sp. 418]|nr:hypothetical protein FRC02_003388 [Tulasnella sp. 418]